MVQYFSPGPNMKLVKGIHIKQAVLDVPPRQIIAMTLVQ
jgi:hypothetical protein